MSPLASTSSKPEELYSSRRVLWKVVSPVSCTSATFEIQAALNLLMATSRVLCAHSGLVALCRSLAIVCQLVGKMFACMGVAVVLCQGFRGGRFHAAAAKVSLRSFLVYVWGRRLQNSAEEKHHIIALLARASESRRLSKARSANKYLEQLAILGKFALQV